MVHGVPRLLAGSVIGLRLYLDDDTQAFATGGLRPMLWGACDSVGTSFTAEQKVPPGRPANVHVYRLTVVDSKILSDSQGRDYILGLAERADS